MPVGMPTPARPYGGPYRPRLVLALCGAAGAGAFGALVLTLPFGLVLPFFSVVMIAGAAVMAAIARTQPYRPQSRFITYWDIAGALTFIGIVAALLSDPEQVLPLMETRQPG